MTQNDPAPGTSRGLSRRRLLAAGGAVTAAGLAAVLSGCAAEDPLAAQARAGD